MLAPMSVETARAAAQLLKPYFADAAGEKLVLVYLDASQKVLAIEEGNREPGDSIELPVRAVIGRALQLDALGLVVAHNHPSGDAHPSDADIAVTRRLADTAAAVGVRLYDHLIFAGEACVSFRQLGLL
jgi:DNA repair protein RadC